MQKSIYRLTLGLILGLYWLNSNGEIAPFTASYILHQGRVHMGHVELTLRRLPDGQFELKSVTEPDGLLAFIRDDVVIETSNFKFLNGMPRPSRYLYQQSEDDNEVRRVELNFNWENKEVTNTANRHSWKMSVPDNTQDKASIQLALMQALASGAQNTRFPVADGGKLKFYRFEVLSNELVPFNEKGIETIKMARHKDNKNSDTTFWCAPSLHYLPIRIVKQKRLGKFSMDLDQVRFEAPQAIKETTPKTTAPKTTAPSN